MSIIMIPSRECMEKETVSSVDYENVENICTTNQGISAKESEWRHSGTNTGVWPISLETSPAVWS